MAKKRPSKSISKYRAQIRRMNQQMTELRMQVEEARSAKVGADDGKEIERLTRELESAKEQNGGLKSELGRYQSVDMREALKVYFKFISSIYNKITVSDDIDGIREWADTLMEQMCDDSETFGIQLSVHKPGEELGDAFIQRKDEIVTDKEELDGLVKKCILIGCKVDAIPSYSFGELLQVWKYDPSGDGDTKE